MTVNHAAKSTERVACLVPRIERDWVIAQALLDGAVAGHVSAADEITRARLLQDTLDHADRVVLTR